MGQEGKRWRGNLDVGSCLSGPGAVVGNEDHYRFMRRISQSESHVIQFMIHILCDVEGRKRIYRGESVSNPGRESTRV